jgi:hypothetical protein
MTEKIRNKLELAKRRNKRRRKFNELSNILSDNTVLKWLKDEKVLHDLRESIDLDDRLYQRILSLRQSNDLRINDKLNKQNFLRYMKGFLTQLGTSLLFLFMSNWRSLGAIKVTASELSNCAQDLLDIDGDTLYGCTKDMKYIFVFDFIVEEGEVYYECSYWEDIIHWCKNRV